MARLNLDIPIAVISPLTTGIDVAYGIREFQDHASAKVLKIGYSLVFQLSEGIQFRSTPLLREFVLDKQYSNQSRYLLSFLDFEAVIDRRIFFRLESPHYSTNGWVPHDYGIEIGYSNKWDLGRWYSDHLQTYHDRAAKDDAWEVPTEEQIKHSYLGSGMSFSATVIDYEFNPYFNPIFGISALVVWDRNSGGVRKPGFANGIELDYAHALELGYLLRYYLTNNIAITTEPLDGVKPFPTQPHPSGDLTWDIQSTAGIIFIMGHSDFTLTLMRLSWRDLVAKQWPFYQDFPAGLRIGANFYVP